jgi:hypothetical protein
MKKRRGEKSAVNDLLLLCRRMLTYADVCRRLLTYADVCYTEARKVPSTTYYFCTSKASKLST